MVKTRIIESEPAMILEEKERYLIISDLHIGFENTVTSNKIFLGKSSSVEQINNHVKNLIINENIDTLILLGDVKSSTQKIFKSEWEDVRYFFEEIMKMTDVMVVPGNHDGNLQKLIPNEVSISSTNGIVIENVLLTHGHALPSKNFSDVNRIVMGHIHPVFFKDDSLLNGQRVWISLKTAKELLFPNTSGEFEITIVPAFNPYFYPSEKKIYKKSISPIVEKIKNESVAKIITLDGTIIGSELKDLL